MAKILIVDDEPAVAEVTALILEDAGHQVAIGRDGLEALQLLQKMHPHSVDLIISDIMMPRMDGRALVQALRSDPHHLSTKIIVMSAHRPALNIADVDGKVAKPYDADELIELVEQVLQHIQR